MLAPKRETSGCSDLPDLERRRSINFPRSRSRRGRKISRVPDLPKKKRNEEENDDDNDDANAVDGTGEDAFAKK